MYRKAGLIVCRALPAFLSFMAGAAAFADDSVSRSLDDGRVLRKEAVVNGPIEEVWRCWTTSEGIATFFSPESNVKLELDGPYELFMRMSEPDKQGKRGSQGCKVLSYIPHEMLAFEWNFPPSIESLRYSGAKTHVVLRFAELPDGRVRVRFAQMGWQKGEDWDKGYAYFDKAWSYVLDQLKARMEKHGDDGAGEEKPGARSWRDGYVTVTASETPLKRQDFEMELPAPVQKVWRLLATSEGFHDLGAKDGKVELTPGGAYAFWPQAPNKVLAFVPHEMLSTSGSAPEKFPNVRKGGTWSAYWFEPIGDDKTRLRLSIIGWRPGEKEWDDAFDYFLKANPQFLNFVHAKLSGEGKKPSGNAAKTESAKMRGADAGEVLRHEGIIDAPVAEVWKALTTKEGMESWMVAHAEIDLRVGGKMRTHYDPKGVLGDENTIENTILSYEPLRMLSIKATKPPASFPFKKAIENMWSVIHFEPVGENRTRVVTIGLGYGDDEDSRKLRAFFDQGNAYTIRKLAEKFAPKADANEAKEPAAGNDAYRSAVDNATKVTHLAPLSRLVGVWESASTESDGGTFHARVVYEWGLFGKIIKSRSYVVKDGVDTLAYESVFAWHPGREEIIGECFSSWDAMYDGVFEVIGDTIKYTWKAYAGDDTTDYYQTIEFKDDASYLWTVFRKKDGEWIQSKQATFHRVAGHEKLSAGSSTKPDATDSSALSATPGHGVEYESYLAHVAAAQGALALNETSAVRRWLAMAPVAFRNWEWRFLDASVDESLRTWTDHAGTVMSIAYSPDGRWLAEALSDGSALLRDAATGKVTTTIPGGGKSLWHITFSADGSRLATSGADGVARIYDTATGSRLAELRHDKTQVYSAAFSPDGKHLATSMLSYVRIWDIETGKDIRTLKGHVERPPVLRVAYSPDGKRLASASWDNHVIVWDAASGDVVHKLGPGYGGDEYTPYNAVVFSSDGKRITAASGTGTCWLWNSESGELIRKWVAHEKTIYGLAMSRDNRQIATGSIDQCVRVWDSESGRRLGSYRGHTDTVWSVAFSVDDKILASGGADKCVKLWSLGEERPGLTVSCQSGVWGTEFSSDGRLLATGSSDRSVRIWDARTGASIAAFEDLPDQVAAVAFSPDGSRVAATTNKPNVHIFDIAKRKQVRELEGHTAGSPDVAWSRDGKWIVSSSYDKTIRVWDANDGRTVHTLSDDDHYSYAIAISSDSRTLASADGDTTIRLWDLITGRETTSLNGLKARPLGVAFSPDDKLIAASGHDQSIHIWDAATGRLLRQMPGHNREVYGLAFAPDGTRLASAGFDETVRLWDVATGVEVSTLVRSETGAYALAFSPDGTRLAAGFVSGEVRILDTVPFAKRAALQSPQAAGEGCARLSRALLAQIGEKP